MRMGHACPVLSAALWTMCNVSNMHGVAADWVSFFMECLCHVPAEAPRQRGSPDKLQEGAGGSPPPREGRAGVSGGVADFHAAGQTAMTFKALGGDVIEDREIVIQHDGAELMYVVSSSCRWQYS